MILYGNLHRQLEDNMADAILRTRDLTTDDRLQCRGEDFAAAFDIKSSDVVFNGIADEFAAGPGIR